MRVVTPTLKSLINEQGGYVVFLVLREYSFIRDSRVYIQVVKNFINGDCIIGNFLTGGFIYVQLFYVHVDFLMFIESFIKHVSNL